MQHERKQHIHIVHVLVQTEVSEICWEGDEYGGFHNHCKGAVESSPNRFPQQIQAAKTGDDTVFHSAAVDQEVKIQKMHRRHGKSRMCSES